MAYGSLGGTGVEVFAAGCLLCLLTASGAPGAPGADKDLVLHYTFDQDHGSVARDLSSHANDGEIFKARYLTETDGRRGVLRFDGKESLLTCPDTDSLYFGGDISLEMWVRLNGPITALWPAFYDNGAHFALYFAYWHSLFVHFNTFNWDLDAWESMVAPVDRHILNDQWSHIAVVVEYPRCRFYRNGRLVRDAYMPFPALGTRYRLPKKIGRECPMDLDEFRLYRRALALEEIAAHASGREALPVQAHEAAVEPHWYEDTVTLRLSAKGVDYGDGHTAEMKLLEGGAAAAGPVTVPVTEAFPGSGRYVASHAFPLADLAGKTVDGVVRIRDAAPAPVKTTAKKGVALAKPEWVDTAEGRSSEVLPPWTPVETGTGPDGALEVRVWGRRHELGTTPFLRRIETRGKEILAAPMRLIARANSGDVTWTPAQTTLTGASDVKAEVAQVFASSDSRLRVAISAVMEFDGYTIFDFSIQAGEAVSLETLLLEIPLRTAHAALCFGDNVYPKTPDVPMSVYHSGAVDGHLSFRFGPTVWLGDEERGLCWQVESDEDWRYADEQAATEVLPAADVTVFRANLVNTPVRLAATEALHYRFALLATPVKPMLRDAWDLRIARSEPYGGDLDLPDRTTNGKPTLQYYAEDAGVRRLFTNVNDVWPWPMPAHKQFARALHRLNKECHAHGLKVHPYLIHGRVPTSVPAFDVHGLHMAKRPVHQHVPSNNPPGGSRPGPITTAYGANSQGTVMYCPRSKALQDAYIHSLARRLDTYGDDGVYLDGTACMVACRNATHGCGVVSNGTIRATWPVFAVREFMKRIYTVVKQRDPDGIVDVHSSFSYNPAGQAYADVFWTGEHWYHLRKTGTDYVAGELTLDMFRTEFTGYPLGVPGETLAYRVAASHRDGWKQVLATSLLHDVPIRFSSYPQTGVEPFELVQKLWKMRDEFGARDAEKLFYWNNRDYVTVSPEKCYATLLRHPRNGVLAFIANLRKDARTVEVTFNLAGLGLRSSKLDVSRPLTGETLTMAADGRLAVPLGSEEWAYVRLRPAAAEGGADITPDGPAANQGPQGNLVANGGLESSDAFAWSGSSAAVERVRTSPHGGSWCLHVADRSQSASGHGQSRALQVPLQGGGRFYAEAWVRVDTEVASRTGYATAALDVQFLDAQGEPLSVQNVGRTSSRRWTRLSAIVTLPSDGARVAFRVVPAEKIPQLVGAAYADDFYLAPVRTAEAADRVQLADAPKPPAGAPEYAAPARPTDGANMALTIEKLTHGLDPPRPMVIWAIGSSFTEFLGNGDDLIALIRQRFPAAPPIVYKTMVGGSTPYALLRGWARHLVIPDQPDVVLIYNFGSAQNLERLIVELQSHTTADIIVGTLHWCRNHEAVWPDPDGANRHMDPAAVRAVCRRYGVELVENRREITRYMLDNDLAIADLLVDAVHQSPYAAAIINSNIARHFHRAEAFTYDPRSRERRVEAALPSSAVAATGDWRKQEDGTLATSKPGALEIRFTGTRIDLIGRRSPNGGTARVSIDGKPGHEVEAYYATYVQPDQDNFIDLNAKEVNLRRVISDRCPHGIRLGDNIVPQEWTILMTSDNGDYELTGSVTGPDGKGNASRTFTSRSGQIIVEHGLWRLARTNRTGDRFTFEVVRSALGEVRFVGPAAEFRVRVASNLSNGPHSLRLDAQGDGPVRVGAFDVFEPPLRPSLQD